jgi:type II secretory pathway pseudopilin PulG
MKSFFKGNKHNLIIASAVAFVILAAGIAYVALRASGFFASSETEQAALSGNAQVISDANASGGQAVQFKAPATTPPPTGGCSGTHVPGGNDGSGSCWPGPNNTGIPVGTTLRDYPQANPDPNAPSESCIISAANMLIRDRNVKCSELQIRAANVVIENSKINGIVFLDTDNANSKNWSFTIRDSEIDGGQQQHPAIGWGNMTLTRVNAHGGITSAQCEEKSIKCEINDSYLHGQYIQPNSNWHLGGFLSDGGGPIKLTHNTIACDQQLTYGSDGGCTGDINLIPNFGTAHDVTIDHNLLPASTKLAYCTYGGDRHDGAYPYGNHIVYTNNIFQRGSNSKCGAYGPVAGWGWGTGNVWTGNKWDNGGDVTPEY